VGFPSPKKSSFNPSWMETKTFTVREGKRERKKERKIERETERQKERERFCSWNSSRTSNYLRRGKKERMT
jgi:hypothetical protein